MTVSNTENTAREIMNQLSKEEMVSFLQQDYSVLIKILELRVNTMNENDTKDKTENIINKIAAMTLETLKDFLVDISSKKGEE